MVPRRPLIALAAAVIAATLLLAAARTVLAQEDPLIKISAGNLSEMQFVSTLHATTKGMRHWYMHGLGAKTGVPYEKLFCVECHVRKLPSGMVLRGCETCHAVVKDGRVVDFSVDVADKSETCLACHGREALAIKLAKKGIIPGDVHMLGVGMTCASCHSSKEVHAMGDYQTMRQAVKKDCKDCHMKGYAPYPLGFIPEHRQHLRDLHCTACHVPTVVTCYSCHFDIAYKSYTTLHKVIKKAYPVVGWVLLVNDTKYNQIHAGNMMVVVWKEKNTYQVDIAPQFPHIVVEKGRTCKDCHGTPVTKEIAEKKEVTLTWWNPKEGKLEWVKGAIPIVEGVKYKLQLVTFNEKTGKWEPYKVITVDPAKALINGGVPIKAKYIPKLAASPKELMKEEG